MELTISRELETDCNRLYYSFATIGEWQKFWKVICEMGYNPNAVQYETIRAHSNTADKDDSQAYGGYTVQNQHLIGLDEVWRKYDKSLPIVNKHLKQIYVPRVLFSCLGTHNWFKFSFPNCEVTYWPE
jgi:hypothetical protein